MIEKTYFAAEVIVSADAREAVEYGLMEAGALGTETRDSGSEQLVTGYFDRQFDLDEVRATLVEAWRVYNLAAGEFRELKVQAVPDRDWLAEWKKSWQPVEIGRFLVAPPWSELPAGLGPSAHRIVIRINPGMAFGTGTHETTRLCLKAIEKYFRGGSFFDVGTGTGILAIAAAKMSPDARIEACDTDAEAIEIAKDNARLNEAGDQIDFRVGSVQEQTASADLVCANLTAPVIVELLPLLIGATCGRLVLSGILDSQVEMVESRLGELGANVLEVDQDGEWVALVV
ncbi:MAG: 50S ribosomal protein L11 methyltransferase [Pyrinomonadaceae bacterium]